MTLRALFHLSLLVAVVLWASPAAAQSFGVNVSGHLETTVDDQTTPSEPVNFGSDAALSLTVPPTTSHQATGSGSADASASGTVAVGTISAPLNATATGSNPMRLATSLPST